MAYKVKQSSIPEVLIINSPVFEDNRGYFFESFNKKDFCSSTNLDIEFDADGNGACARRSNLSYPPVLY